MFDEFASFLLRHGYKRSTVDEYIKNIVFLANRYSNTTNHQIQNATLEESLFILNEMGKEIPRKRVFLYSNVLNKYFLFLKKDIHIDKKLLSIPNGDTKSCKNVYDIDFEEIPFSSEYDRAIVLFVYKYHFSVDNIYNMEIKNFDLSDTVLKVDNIVRVLDENDVAFLQRIIENNRKYMFENFYGRRYSKSTIYRIIKRYCPDYSPKDFIKDRINISIQAGADVEYIKKYYNYKSYAFLNTIERGK